VRLYSENNKEARFDFLYRNFSGFSDISCVAIDYARLAEEADVIFSALPYGALMERLDAEILDSVRFVDMGVDYRLADPALYQKCYGKEHKSIGLAERFTYGLSEWNRANIAGARHIANPGCFAAAIELALLPLVASDVIEDDVIVDGKCSLSGAGRSLSLGTHFAEANESVKPYKILSHPHRYEAERAVAMFSGRAINLTFVPHIVPMQRGILVSCYARARQRTDYGEIRGVFGECYAGEPFIRILDRGMYVETKWVRNSNVCHINFELDEDGRGLVVFAAFDNLVKGAAGSAVQNFNIMCGFPETMGLETIPTSI
jgi:N-acetyl-gamma-glutamyl-phosphate reductase